MLTDRSAGSKEPTDLDLASSQRSMPKSRPRSRAASKRSSVGGNEETVCISDCITFKERVQIMTVSAHCITTTPITPTWFYYELIIVILDNSVKLLLWYLKPGTHWATACDTTASNWISSFSKIFMHATVKHTLSDWKRHNWQRFLTNVPAKTQ